MQEDNRTYLAVLRPEGLSTIASLRYQNWPPSWFRGMKRGFVEGVGRNSRHPRSPMK